MNTFGNLFIVDFFIISCVTQLFSHMYAVSHFWAELFPCLFPAVFSSLSSAVRHPFFTFVFPSNLPTRSGPYPLLGLPFWPYLCEGLFLRIHMLFMCLCGCRIVRTCCALSCKEKMKLAVKSSQPPPPPPSFALPFLLLALDLIFSFLPSLLLCSPSGLKQPRSRDPI